MHADSVIKEMHTEPTAVFYGLLKIMGENRRFPGEEIASLWAQQDLSERITAGYCTVPAKHSPQALWTWPSLSTELDGVFCLTAGVTTKRLDSCWM